MSLNDKKKRGKRFKCNFENEDFKILKKKKNRLNSFDVFYFVRKNSSKAFVKIILWVKLTPFLELS